MTALTADVVKHVDAEIVDTLEFKVRDLYYEPRPYQWDGIRFLRSKKKAMISDPPGLGKTLQAMMAAADGESIGIACPTYLTEHWWEQIRQQFPNDSVVLASGVRSDRDMALALGGKAKWTIFNHQMLRFKKKPSEREVPHRRDLKFQFPEFDTIILDESHHFKNRQSQQAKAAYVLARSCDRVFELSGTPIMKEADDLFMQLRMLDPLTFTSYWQFINTYCQVYHTGFGTEVHGQRGTSLKRLMERYALRRTYEEVGLYLPDIIHNTIKVDFTSTHLKQYKDARDALRVNDIYLENFMQVMHVLRALTGVQEKINATIDLCQDLDRFIIFCWYTHHAKPLAKALDATLIISEEVPPEKRKQLVAESTKVVCTLGSLKEGVDAAHLRNVVFFEEDWAPGGLEQAEDRVRRWSASSESARQPVNCYSILVKGTIDETIHNVKNRRAVNAKDIIKQEMSRK